MRFTISRNFPVFIPKGGDHFQGKNTEWAAVFILRFTITSIQQWATYYRGSDDDWCDSITTDGSGNVFVVVGFVLNLFFLLFC